MKNASGESKTAETLIWQRKRGEEEDANIEKMKRTNRRLHKITMADKWMTVNHNGHRQLKEACKE